MLERFAFLAHEAKSSSGIRSTGACRRTTTFGRPRCRFDPVPPVGRSGSIGGLIENIFRIFLPRLIRPIFASVEPGGARTDFRYRSARVADPIPAYDGTPAHAFQAMLNPENGLAPGDPERMAARIIESARRRDVPLRVVLGSQALACTIDTLEKRLADFRTQTDVARSTDFD